MRAEQKTSHISLDISTGSLYPSDPKKPWEAMIPYVTTELIANNALAFKEAVGSITPEALKDSVAVGVSFHWSDRIDAGRLVRNLDAHGIPVTSHDIPDIESLAMLAGKIKETLRTGSSLSQKLQATILDGGWYLVNSGSEQARVHRLHEAMFATKNSTVSPVIIRTSLSEFMRSRDTSPLFRILQSYTVSKNIALALEIDAKDYTPGEYMETIRRLHGETYHGIPIFADIDLGHIAETKKYHPRSEIPDVNYFFRSVMAGTDAMLVAAVSLNQYAGDAHTHMLLDNPNGHVNIPQAGLSLAEGRKRLPFGPVVIVETYPQHTQALLKNPQILGQFLQKFI